jgi:hypothetical protein
MIGLLMLIALFMPVPVQKEPKGTRLETASPDSNPAASMVCAAGPARGVETNGVRGRDGSVFVLAIASDDDHSKNSHQCESAYSLVRTRQGKPVESVDLGFGTIDRYGRRLEVRAEGFSPDGKRFFGLVCESGVAIQGEAGEKPYQSAGADATLIEYWLASGKKSTFDLGRLVPYSAGCGAEVIRVLGVITSGEAVLELTVRGLTRRWVIEPESTSMRPLPAKMSFALLDRGEPR